MPHGKHVGREECKTIRRRIRQGAMGSVLADELGYDRQAIYYHGRGDCAHDTISEEPVERGRQPAPGRLELLGILATTIEHVLTTGEIMQRCTHDYANTETVRKELKRLHGNGEIGGKQASRAWVWWLPDDAEIMLGEPQ